MKSTAGLVLDPRSARKKEEGVECILVGGLAGETCSSAVRDLGRDNAVLDRLGQESDDAEELRHGWLRI
jgi:hypothetical protein